MEKSSQPTRLAVSVMPRDHMLGPLESPLTLVEYGDYECPDCLNAEPLVKAIRGKMGDQLRFVFRHFPKNNIHPHASVAAQAAETAATQGKFWEMHEMLFKHQKTLADVDFTHLAMTLGLEVYRFQAELSSEIHAKRVRDDFLGGERSGVSSTPTFFINEYRYEGAEQLDSLLAALAAAKANPPI